MADRLVRALPAFAGRRTWAILKLHALSVQGRHENGVAPIRPHAVKWYSSLPRALPGQAGKGQTRPSTHDPSTPSTSTCFPGGNSIVAEQLIISVSGLRGIVGETLTPEVAGRYAAAFAQSVAPGPMVLTRDGRASGPMLADAVRAVLNALGRDVLDAGIAATPTTGILVREQRAAGGIQISASHNPAPYNGLKLFGSAGRVLSAAEGQGILDHYRRAPEPAWVPVNLLGRTIRLHDTLEVHLQRVLATVDVQRIRKCRFRVLLDSNHGAGSLLGARLLEHLHCDTTFVGNTPDGNFRHVPEPTRENLAGISQLVRSSAADVGFCQDPDADRLALIDETGRYIGEEYTLAITLDHILGQATGPVVTNCSSSRMSEDLAAAHGVPFYRSAVGEANVTDVMIREQAVFGGEGNGGPIDPRVGYVRDSFVGMAQVLDALAARGEKLSEIVDRLPKYEIVKTKVSVDPAEIPALLDRLEQHFDTATADRCDGLRLDWPDAWLLVRASNTEPIVRLVAEAVDQPRAAQLCEQAARAIANGHPV